MVDCRDCVYFVPRWRLTEHEWEALKLHARRNVWREKPARGEYGYCSRLNIVITYYEGHCRFFEAKEKPLLPELDPRQEKITRFLGGE